MKILVGYPPLESEKGTPLLSQNRQFQYFNNPTFLYPVEMATAATMLKNSGHEVMWIDCAAQNVSKDKFFKILEREKFDLFIFETKSPVAKRQWELSKEFKRKFPNMKLVIVGDHVSWEEGTRETMQNSEIDFAVNGGYFDFAVSELVEALTNNKEIPKGVWYRNGAIVEQGRYNFRGNINDAPFPDRNLVPIEPYSKEYNLARKPHTYIMSGRDCWYGKCTFCVWDHTLYPKGTFRVRSPENVLDEVGILIEKYGIKEIFDDCGTITIGNWLKEFCEGMIKRGYNKKVAYSCNMRFGAVTLEEYKLMKKAGFRLLKFGLESACQKTIDKLDKSTKIEEIEPSCRDAKKAGLVVHLTIMVGYPWETREDALNTLSFAKKLMITGAADVLQSTVVMPYPGTPLYEEARQNGWMRFDSKAYERFDMTEPVFKTPDMKPDEVMKICDSIYTKTFLSPRYIVRQLFSIKNFEDLKYTISGAKAVLGHIRDFDRRVRTEA